MEKNYGNLYRYFITIRKHRVKEYVTKRELDMVRYFLSCHINGAILDTVYEVDPVYHQLHMHLWVLSAVRIRYKDLSKVMGFRIYYRQIKGDINPLLRYMRKEDQNEVFIKNYYMNNYGF